MYSMTQFSHRHAFVLLALWLSCGCASQQRMPVDDAPASNDAARATLAEMLVPRLAMPDEQAQHLESQLAIDPQDTITRAKLLYHYSQSNTQQPDPAVREAFATHLFWFITHRPGSYVLGQPEVRVDHYSEPALYEQTRQLWLRQVHDNPRDPAVMGNAAAFVIVEDTQLSERLLLDAQKLAPDEPQWADRLAQLYLLEAQLADDPQQQIAWSRRALAQARRSVELTRGPARSDKLEQAAQIALTAQDWPAMDGLTRQMIDAGGRATHMAHVLRGQAALARGDIARAERELLLSTDVPRRDANESWSMDLNLAQQLLDRQRVETVRAYLQRSRERWPEHVGTIDTWSQRTGLADPSDDASN